MSSLPPTELRKIALKEMSPTALSMCDRCDLMTWMTRKINHQMIEVKPAKVTKGRLSRAAKRNAYV